MTVEGKFIEKIALLVFVRMIFRCFSPSQKPQVLMRTKTYTTYCLADSFTFPSGRNLGDCQHRFDWLVARNIK